MTLHQSVFYTKRVLVILIFVLFACTGIRIFSFISNRLSIREEIIGTPKSEAGFGKLPPLEINELPDAQNFKPKKFRISTITGLLDTENGFPKQETAFPIVNIYKVLERPIDITNTEDPVRIAQAMKFETKYKEVTNVRKEWNESNRKLSINGQYKTVKYQNLNLIKNNVISDFKPNDNDDSRSNISSSSDALKAYFENVLNTLKIPVKFDDHRFSLSFLEYDESKGSFYPSENASNSSYIRIDAKRIYPNITKEEKAIQATASYPHYHESINYMILINNRNISNLDRLMDFLVEISIFNWPLDTKITSTNVNIQTYQIITTSEAYNRLSNYQGKLVSVINLSTSAKVDVKEIEDIEIVDILKLRIEYYEDYQFMRHIQPVYVFIVEAQKDGKKYELIYYVPALSDNFLLN